MKVSAKALVLVGLARSGAAAPISTKGAEEALAPSNGTVALAAEAPAGDGRSARGVTAHFAGSDGESASAASCFIRSSPSGSSRDPSGRRGWLLEYHAETQI